MVYMTVSELGLTDILLSVVTAPLDLLRNSVCYRTGRSPFFLSVVQTTTPAVRFISVAERIVY